MVQSILTIYKLSHGLWLWPLAASCETTTLYWNLIEHKNARILGSNLQVVFDFLTASKLSQTSKVQYSIAASSVRLLQRAMKYLEGGGWQLNHPVACSIEHMSSVNIVSLVWRINLGWFTSGIYCSYNFRLNPGSASPDFVSDALTRWPFLLIQQSFLRCNCTSGGSQRSCCHCPGTTRAGGFHCVNGKSQQCESTQHSDNHGKKKSKEDETQGRRRRRRE